VSDPLLTPTNTAQPDRCLSKAVHAYVLQVIVLTNHMNGKDTHIRGLRILGPEESVDVPFSLTCSHVSHRKEPDLDGTNDPFPWTTTPFKMYRQIR
jgi:anaphase-promoting complex subunit 10